VSPANTASTVDARSPSTDSSASDLTLGLEQHEALSDSDAFDLENVLQPVNDVEPASATASKVSAPASKAVSTAA